MAKAQFHPLLKWLRGAMKGIVFRVSHNGKTSAYMRPDMSRVKWSPAQVAQRERLAEASAYGTKAIRDPELRAYYVQMAVREKKNKNRPYDMAIKHYCDGNNLLGDKFSWDVEWWREMKKYRKKRKR